jgi:hypothetical protein
VVAAVRLRCSTLETRVGAGGIHSGKGRSVSAAAVVVVEEEGGGKLNQSCYSRKSKAEGTSTREGSAAVGSCSAVLEAQTVSWRAAEAVAVEMESSSKSKREEQQDWLDPSLLRT